MTMSNAGTMSPDTKAFRAPTMAAALAQVQRELGAEALVVATRRVLASAPWQVWKSPEFEVLATPGQASTEDSSAKALVSVANLPANSESWPKPISECYQRLIAQDCESELARALVTNAMEMLGPRALNDTRVVYDYIRSELASRFHIGEYLPRRGEPRIVVLAGMSGAGKTSAAAKLAAYAHYTLGHSAALINLDTFRVGALNQARTFADILQLPLCNAYTPAELEAALVVHRNTDVIVIDTPGRNPFKPGEMIELATLLAPLPASRRTYLVASATSKLKDLAEAVSAFKGIGLNGLIFTKLDETRTYGALYSLAALTALPAAYFCSGPRIPQDIEPASTEKLMELLLATA